MYDIRGYDSEDHVRSGKYTVVAEGMEDREAAIVRARLYLGVYHAVKVQGLGYIIILRGRK